MHHLYPSSKGDQLCPLGFHPQTRYPTRCKRCFRDYKDHGGRRGSGFGGSIDDVAASSPNLSESFSSRNSTRSWTSTQNLSSLTNNSNEIVVNFNIELKKRPQSWTSTPNIEDAKLLPVSGKTAQNSELVEPHVDVTLKLPLPPKRHVPVPVASDISSSKNENVNSTSSTNIKVTNSSPSSLSTPSPSSSSTTLTNSRSIPEELIIRSSDSLAERARKMNLLKKQRSQNSRESSRERSLPRKTENDETPNIPAPTKKERPNSTGSINLPPPVPRPLQNSSSTVTKSASNATELKEIVLPQKISTSSTTLNNHDRLPVVEKKPTSVFPPQKDNQLSLAPLLPPKNLVSSSLTSTSTKSKINSNATTIAGSSSSNTPSMMTSKVSSAPSSTNIKLRSKTDLERQRTAKDVEFMLNVKDKNLREQSKKESNTSDNMSVTTEATDSPLLSLNKAVKHEERLEELKQLRIELDTMKARAEKAEKEKSDILLRRLATIDSTTNRSSASEALNLQKKVNELKEQLEKVNEEKRKLNTRMKDIERSSGKTAEHDLKRKLNAAEQICEELMEENQAARKEIINLQAEMDELQDTFREDELKAKTTLQKDLEKTTKNCRILSFKLKKCERKIESLEQDRQGSGNEQLHLRIKQLEDELRFSNDLTKKLQIEAEELRAPPDKRAPKLGILGKSSSADGRMVTRESLTRGGSQEDPQQLLRDLQDSVERESDLREQLKFAEEEAENLRKKVARVEDENDTLMMQLKKMATRSRTYNFATELHTDRDEGISDEDDPAELRILLDLNEQEASILRQKVEDLEKQNTEAKKQLKELQEKLHPETGSGLSGNRFRNTWSTSDISTERRLKTVNEELQQMKKSLDEKDKLLESHKLKGASEKEMNELRLKILTLETENKRLQGSSGKTIGSGVSNFETINKLKDNLKQVELERDSFESRLKFVLQEAEEKLPPRKSIRVTDLTPKNQLKKWVEELETEIGDMRTIVMKSGAHQIGELMADKKSLLEEVDNYRKQLTQTENELQKFKGVATSATKNGDLEKNIKKLEEDKKNATNKLKDLEEKLKKQDNLIREAETQKLSLEQQIKSDKERISKMEKDSEKERKDREKLESKLNQKESDLQNARAAADKIKQNLEKEMKELKAKVAQKAETKQKQELKRQIEELRESLTNETKRYEDLNTRWEAHTEEATLSKAKLITENNNLQNDLKLAQNKLAELESANIARTELNKKLSEAKAKIEDLEAKILKSNSLDYEKTLLQNKLKENTQEYDRLRRENDMNIDLVFQLRKDNDELSRKLNDYSRIEQVKASKNDHALNLEMEIKSLKTQLDNSELQSKSEVAATRLRYEQQVKNLSTELTSMQRQCERFKRDRDTFKQMLEIAQKKIGDLKANNSGRISRSSMHSSDEDDKSKIAYLEQQTGCLEDQLVEARLEVSKVKTELVSERSANEIKISEMQSKLNEFEEERVLGTGRTKIPGMKTRLELSWQKEREEQQRLLQETSTLARDLRQTLFEVERERDKERLESKRRQEQLKRSNEEEMEEGRKKVSELQCDLLELRDVHAKIRTSNEKLRRERERYEKELIRRRMEQEGSDRRVSSLMQTIDELVKIAPEILTVVGQNRTGGTAYGTNSLKPGINDASMRRRSRSPSPLHTGNASKVVGLISRLSETSEELRKFQKISEEDRERARMRRGSLRRAASQENDPHGSQSSMTSVGSTSSIQRTNGSKPPRHSHHNGQLTRKSLSLDQSMQKDQIIWRQDEGSISSMQSIDSTDLGGMIRDSSIESRLDSRLSGGSTQSDIPQRPRKKKSGLMGKLRNLAKSGRNSESEISMQGSDSDISLGASDFRSSKKDLRNRLSDMFKRSGSTSRSASAERMSSEYRPVAVTIVGDEDGPKPRDPPPLHTSTPKPIRSINKPPSTPTPTTPLTVRRRVAK